MITGRLRILIFVAGLVPLCATAIDVDTPLSDPAQIELYERLTEEVRCLVCQNQTIGDSNAALAADLRREVREQVAAGKSEAEIKVFLTDRYGDFVLYKPRYGGAALLLWLAPAILLLFGFIMFWRSLRRRAQLPMRAAQDNEA